LPPQTNKGNHPVVALQPILTINAAGLPPRTHPERRPTGQDAHDRLLSLVAVCGRLWKVATSASCKSAIRERVWALLEREGPASIVGQHEA
jgi:hypothetical protein